jgi:Uma2 family endonuclease
MNKFAEIRYALAQLNDTERKDIIAWLERFGERVHGADKVEEPPLAYGESFPEYVSPEYMTRAEFLDFQEKSFLPYEYVNGIIRAMSGPSVAHCLITQNIHRVLDSRLRGGPCQSFCTGGEINLTLGDDEIVYHPDVYVSCDRSVWDPRWSPNPKFVVEVLSPSTLQIDRREKATNYRRVDSLDEYVMVSQQRPEVTIYRRADRWRPDVSVGPRAVAEFRSFGVSVPLVAIYEGVVFAAAPSATEA